MGEGNWKRGQIGQTYEQHANVTRPQMSQANDPVTPRVLASFSGTQDVSTNNWTTRSNYLPVYLLTVQKLSFLFSTFIWVIFESASSLQPSQTLLCERFLHFLISLLPFWHDNKSTSISLSLPTPDRKCARVRFFTLQQIISLFFFSLICLLK